MNKPKSKKCKNCGEYFEIKSNPLQYVCEYKCAIEYAKKKQKQKEEKEWRKEKKVRKDKLKTRGAWEQDLQKEINKLIRLIDYGQPCISCNREGKEQAGHYHTTKSKPAIRYNLMNIFLQCYYCNVELSANIIGYNKGLRSVFGEDFQEFVEIGLPKLNYLGMTKNEVIEKISLVRKFIREYNPTKLSTADRLKVREIYQELLGIYS